MFSPVEKERERLNKDMRAGDRERQTDRGCKYKYIKRERCYTGFLSVYLINRT